MNWKRAAIATIAAAPVLALFAFGFTRDPGEIPSPLPGREAPAFALPVFATGEAPLAREVGDTIALGDLAGKVVVVNFWASWCLACRDEHVALSETAKRYADGAAQFIGVLYHDRPGNGLRWIERMGGQSYPSVTDDRSRMAINYGLYGVPETFVIDQNGIVVHKQIGTITRAQLDAVIRPLLTDGAGSGVDAPAGVVSPEEVR